MLDLLILCSTRRGVYIYNMIVELGRICLHCNVLLATRALPNLLYCCVHTHERPKEVERRKKLFRVSEYKIVSTKLPRKQLFVIDG